MSPFTSVYDDFTMLTQCDHIIFTEGTFGWWAAWLMEHRIKYQSLGGNPLVLYYKYPVYNNSWGKKFIKRHVFPNNWLSYTKDSVESERTND